MKQNVNTDEPTAFTKPIFILSRSNMLLVLKKT